MKKTLAILSAMLMLVACGNDKLSVETPDQELQETGGFKVNLTISTADTKAYVKSSFATNDVVFIFFDGIASPKYLEAKRTNSGTWEYTAKNGLAVDDLEGAASKKMTAVYLPYGSSSTVVAGEGGVFGFTPTYEGYFLKDEKSSYTISSGTLSGTLTLGAPALNSGEVYIHFDVQGFTSSNDYSMYQKSVRPLALAQVSSDGTITLNEGNAGNPLKGYEDGSNLTFSGALAASAVGSAKDYQFSLRDDSKQMLYIYDAGSKTISESKYIGLGDITSKWTGFKALGYFSVSANKQVYFSQGNLQASTTDNGASWTWSFAENQWDFIGNSAANNAIDGSMSVSSNGKVDLFGWNGASSSYDNYGINNSTTAADYSKTAGEALKHDWGHNQITNGGNIADAWRTMTHDEWAYLLKTRTASTVGGTENGRFAKAMLFGTTCGIILFPDNYTHPAGVAEPEIVNDGTTSTNYKHNKYSAADWALMEANGAVFLPASGVREGTTISSYQISGSSYPLGFYASSTNIASGTKAGKFYYFRVDWAYVNPEQNWEPYLGVSVRLVRDVE